MEQSYGLVFLDECPRHSLTLPPQGHHARAQMSLEEPGATFRLCAGSAPEPRPSRLLSPTAQVATVAPEVR